MSTPSTNIRVFAHWTEQTVFAGEDIECHITFKNVASIPTLAKASLQAPAANGFALGGQRKGPSSKNGHSLANKALPVRGHRATLSLNTPVTVARPPPVSGSWNGGSAKPKDGHKRSVSIISIGASESAIDETASHKSLGEASRKVIRGHGRSASLQIVPRRNGLVSGPTSAPVRHQSATQPSPLLVTSFSPSLPSATGTPKSGRSSRRPGITTAPGTPAIGGPHSARRQDSGSFAQNFRFPAASNLSAEARQVETLAGDEIDSANPNSRLLSPARDGGHHAYEHAAPAARILSPASIAGTPRSSGEFYSLASNNSSETLASEYLPHQPGRIPNFPSYSRRPSNLSPISQKPSSETLMMGYAQIHGSFTVDGSLISQAPFDEVKRKGAVGGQGGGVIGVETSKRNSGVFQFGWNNIGDSLSGLLGGGELSSIKDMRSIASSKSVPLLSTPQSILFVDLRLAPGESKTYKYSFSLPRGLPPSHRGKAIKISYKLVIGTQRPGGAKEQQVKSVEVPFRVLGSVNSHGELLGHDLMSPYIILQDQARVKMTTSPSISSLRFSRSTTKPTTKANQESSLTDFLSYVDELLTRPRQNSSYGLLSPTESPLNRRQSSVVEETTRAKEAIDLAILRSNTATEYQQSANRFEITRGGKRVAVVMLARPAYRLGETITAAFDFTNAEIPCYAIHASLETSEKIDSSLALRSEASVLRVTRKTYASHSESTLFARRVVFSPSIPSSATPEFITSGVSLDWRIRIEFVTPRLSRAAPDGDTDAQPPQPTYTDLLEEVARDDRGVVLAAAEALDCESFEIAVPLRVYGALAGTAERGEEAPVEGLAV